MKQRLWSTLGAAALLAMLRSTHALAEEGSAASDVARAESYAADAFDAYSRKEYPRAVDLYRKALEAAPSADIVYNLARIYDTKLSDRPLAIEFYQRYTSDTSAEPNRLRIASERLARLRELEAVAAEPTRQEVAAPSHYESAPETRPSSQPRSHDITGLQYAGILIGSAGVVGIGIGTGFGIAASNDADVAHKDCDGNACRTLRGVDAARNASDSALVSTVSFIAGGALLLGGISLLIFGSAPSEERESAALQVVPYLGPGALGTHLAGRF